MVNILDTFKAKCNIELKFIYFFFFEVDKLEWSCIKLRCLNVSYNNLEMLSTEISSCSGLVELDVSNNKLVVFFFFWECKLVNVL